MDNTSDVLLTKVMAAYVVFLELGGSLNQLKPSALIWPVQVSEGWVFNTNGPKTVLAEHANTAIFWACIP
jgi:hypothetical protein